MSETRKPAPENTDEQQEASPASPASPDQPSGGPAGPIEQGEPHAQEDQEQQASGVWELSDDPSLLSDDEATGPSEENSAPPDAEEPASPVGTDAEAAAGGAADAEQDATAPAPRAGAEAPDRLPPEPEDEDATNGGLKHTDVPDATEEDEEDEEDSEDDDELHEPMSFLDHMNELRVRLVRCFIAAGVGFLACYGFHNELFALLMAPLVKVFPPGSSLIYTGLPEAFFTYIKVSLVAGVLLTSPYIFYQVWSFIAPGLYKEEKKYLIPIAFCSGIFFAVGAIFGYSVVFPFAFGFFMEFATETIKPMPSLKEYLSFSLKLLFAFGFTFELPLFAFFLGKLGVITAEMLRKIRKYAFLCAFVVAAVLTPPDIVSQVLMAGPLIILFEISIWVVQIFGRRKPQQEPEEEEEEDAEASPADSE